MKNKDIKILDCTLRDGGYVNNFELQNDVILSILQKLVFAKIDIIECGFLDEKKGRDFDYLRFKDINVINNLLKNVENINSQFVAMLEYGKYDVEKLSYVNKRNNTITGIRLSFRKSKYRDIINIAKEIIKKNYDLFIQPIATELYNDNEILDLIHICNDLNIKAMYIVDTHGSMMREDIRRLFYLFDRNLRKDIALGFHSHNNLQMSYANAIDFIDISRDSFRDIFIDSSIYGMGRGAGNLNTELLAEYLNKKYQKNYNINYLLDIVDEYLISIKKEHNWGYSLEHFLSASQKCHPNYASFLINKKNLSINEIKELLEKIPFEERREYNKNIIEQIYIQNKQKSLLPVKELTKDFFNKEILLIASGNSVNMYYEKINNLIKQNKFATVSINHLNPYINSEFVFFSNQLRYNQFADKLNGKKLIVTSNIKVKSIHKNCYVLPYKELFKFKDINFDNSTILFINYLASKNVKKISIAGLDGYDVNNRNYIYNEYNKINDPKYLMQMNEDIGKALKKLSEDISIEFITPSFFQKFIHKKIIGVIPARYGSTRLPGKPLKDIAGLPMIIHVLKRAQMSKILDKVIVATDDERIFNLVKQYDGEVIMTSKKHNNGSERMYEVSRKIYGDIYVVINGDEALLNPIHIDKGVEGLLNSDAPVSLLFNKFNKKNSPSDFKVVFNQRKEIMYISRNDIPSNARSKEEYMFKAYHIMSYKREFLDTYIRLPQTPLDRIESHELLRVLEHGYKIQGVEVNSTAISVDTAEDLEYVRKVMPNDPIFQQYKFIIGKKND